MYTMPDTHDTFDHSDPQEQGKMSWEEQSGFLEFLGSVASEVARFNESMKFKLRYEVSPPETIDGDRNAAAKTGFVITLRKGLFPEKTYCIYSTFTQHALHSFLGLYEQGRISTLCELDPLSDSQESASYLYDWLKALIKASDNQ